MRQLVKGLRVNRALLLLSLTQNYISDVGAGLLAEVRDSVCVCVCVCACVRVCVCARARAHWYTCIHTTLLYIVAYVRISSWCVITSACYLHCAPMLHPLQALSNQFVLTHEEIVHRRRLLVSAAGRGGEEGGVDMDSSTVGLTPRNSLTMQASPDKHARGSKLDRGSAKQAGKKDSAKKDDKGGRKEDKPRQSEQLRTTCTWASLINAYHSFLHMHIYVLHICTYTRTYMECSHCVTPSPALSRQR